MEPVHAPSLIEQIGRNRWLSALLWCVAAVLALVAFAGPVHAQMIVVDVDEISVTDAAEPVELTYSEQADDGNHAVGLQRFAEVDVDVIAPSSRPIASYGPFHVLRDGTIEMIGTVDSSTPAAFAALRRAHPEARRLVMRECPGSVDEHANLALARAMRRAGMSTHVPSGGSVRSGAVELWLAGVQRTAEPGAEFGVHSWRDADGREAADYADSDPVHEEYLGYYREMGLDDGAARRFYALTNSVGFDDVRLLSAADMGRLGLLTTAS
jgi:hypothetical protein